MTTAFLIQAAYIQHKALCILWPCVPGMIKVALWERVAKVRYNKRSKLFVHW